MLIYAGSRGYLDSVKVDDVGRWKGEFLRYMDTSNADVGQSIRETYQLAPETEENLKQAIE
jgi:F-type H+/Na+-transporting ATPase subunit alpha